MIKKHENIETIFKKEKNNYDFSGLNEKLLVKIRKVFLFPDVLTNFERLKITPPNKAKVLELMCQDHNLNKERVEQNFNNLENYFFKCQRHFKNVNISQSVSKKVQLTF